MAVTHSELSELTEQSLVESWHAGDHAAFDRIVRRYQAGLLTHARRRLGNQQAAEDAVQETLLRAYRALPRFNGEYRLGSWLHRILRNVCVDEANRNRRRLALVARLTATDPPCVHEAVEQTVMAGDRSEVVRALDELPESYRRAFVLRAVDELPYDEVAKACDISEENARARVSRARTVLRRTTARLSTLVAMVGFGVRRSRVPVAPTGTTTSSASASTAASSASSTASSVASTASQAASSATQVASTASSTVSQVVSGPSPLALQLTTAVHDFAPAAGAASRAIAVLASAAAVVIPAALTPDRNDTSTEARVDAAAEGTQPVELELAAGATPIEVPATAVPTETTEVTQPTSTPQVTASELAVEPVGEGWTVGGRLSIDTGTAVYEGTIEPNSELRLAPAEPGDPGRARPFEITAFVTLDDGQTLTLRFTGSAVLVEPDAAAEPTVEAPVTTTAPPADPADPSAPAATTTTLVADGATPPETTTTTATTTPPADDPVDPAPADPTVPAVERFEISGMYVAEGSGDAALIGGGRFYGIFVIGGAGGGSLQLSLASPSS